MLADYYDWPKAAWNVKKLLLYCKLFLPEAACSEKIADFIVKMKVFAPYKAKCVIKIKNNILKSYTVKRFTLRKYLAFCAVCMKICQLLCFSLRQCHAKTICCHFRRIFAAIQGYNFVALFKIRRFVAWLKTHKVNFFRSPLIRLWRSCLLNGKSPSVFVRKLRFLNMIKTRKHIPAMQWRICQLQA